MGGNARLDNYARGVLQDLYARALFLDDGTSQLCIMSLDLLGVFQREADILREAVAAELAISPENVTIASTHTHSGPDTFQTLCWNDDKLQRDEELLKPFWQSLPAKLQQAARLAKQNAQEAEMIYGIAENQAVANNRRLRMKTGETRMNWELPPADQVDRPLGPVDPKVSLVMFRQPGGAALGGFLHFACHPAILAGANLEMSGDWPGLAMSQLEQELACPAMLYLHGASGNVNHIDYRHPERGRDANEVHRCADSIAGTAKQIIASLPQLGNHDTHLQIENTELLQPLREITPQQIASAKQILASYDGRDLSMPDGIPPELNARRTLKLDEAKETGSYSGRFGTLRDGKLVLPLQLIRIGDVVIGTVPGEIFVEYGFQFRDKIQARPHTNLALLVSLANGVVNYIPTPEAFEQGGYEPGLGPSYMRPNAGNEIVDTLVQMATSHLD